jgi:O-antigen/teichoic acid export membrane protein
MRLEHVLRGRAPLLGATAWSAVGTLVPALIAVPSIGYVARNLSVEEFGELSILWSLVGFSGLLDFGLSRGIAYGVAKTSCESRIREIFIHGTSIALIASSLFTIIFTSLGITLLACRVDLWSDNATSTLAAVFATIPWLVASSLNLALLEGKCEFRLVNTLRAAIGVASFLGPLCAVLMGGGYSDCAYAVVIARAVGFFGTILARSVRLNYGEKINLSAWQESKRLLAYGGWITVSNVVGPIMTTLDKFLLGLISGPAQVGIYAGPTDLASRLAVIPALAARASFPVIAKCKSDAELRQIYLEVFTYVSTMALIVFGTAFFLSRTIIELWLGENYIESGSLVLQIAVVGALANSLAVPAFTYLQALGKSDFAAKVHLLEVIPFLIIFYWLATAHGIYGAAIATCLRMFADAIIFLIAKSRLSIKLEK